MASINERTPHNIITIVRDSAHDMIHQEKGYMAGILWGDGAEIADNGTVDVLLQVDKKIHLIYEIACGGNAEVYFYENPTFSAAGTAMTAFNKNRSSTKTSTATITHTPTITGTGTALPFKLLPGGLKTAGSGGADGSFLREIILKSGNDYLIRVKNISGALQPISIHAEWYEP